MQNCTDAVIDPIATGRNIYNLRKERGLSVKDIQLYFNFNEPKSVYKWQAGQCLPSLDNLYSLSALFNVPMDSIIVGEKRRATSIEPQDKNCGSVLFYHVLHELYVSAQRSMYKPYRANLYKSICLISIPTHYI